MQKPTLAQLTICIWVYDVDKHPIHWASPSALLFWESDSIEELTARDFSAVTSDALRETLQEFQQSFDHDYKLAHNWQFSPRGIEKHAFSQLSGFTLEDGRTAMLVEAMPIDKLSYDMQINLTIMSSDYASDGRFISGNPPFMQEMGRHVPGKALWQAPLGALPQRDRADAAKKKRDRTAFIPRAG